MKLSFLKAKIHRAVVTEADLNYEGSIGIDADLLHEANIMPYEQVEVYNITNGARFSTYAIELPAGSKRISINGAAARLAQVGDLVIICAYCQLEESEVKAHKPTIVLI
jgi:aspartate 1-decarboxylase